MWATRAVNIEGMAVQDGRLTFGLRGPVADGAATLLSVDADALFDRPRRPEAVVSTLALGAHTGIRDLVAVTGGSCCWLTTSASQTVDFSVCGSGTAAAPDPRAGPARHRPSACAAATSQTRSPDRAAGARGYQLLVLGLSMMVVAESGLHRGALTPIIGIGASAPSCLLGLTDRLVNPA
jgi:hypothetical protein